MAHHFKSSILSLADYDEATQSLTLHLRTGAVYQYTDVPPEVYRDFTRAESAGQFFQKAIRSQFQGVKVEKDRLLWPEQHMLK